MKSKTKVIIALVVILVIFVVGLTIIIVNKFSGADDLTNSDSDSSISSDTPVSDQLDSSVPTDSNITSSNNSITDSTSTVDSTSSEEISDIGLIPVYVRPEIEFTVEDIDFAGTANLTSEQNTEDNCTRLGRLVANTVGGKKTDYVQILDTSTKDRVIIDIHFDNGEIVNYSVLFDPINTLSYTRCVTSEMYDFIMNGGNL